MQRAWLLASWAFVGTSVVIACGGAEDTELFTPGGGGLSSGASGNVEQDGGPIAPEDAGGTEEDATPGPQDSGPGRDATVDSGPPDAGPKACRMAPAANDCPATEYCQASACGASLGSCVKLPTSLSTKYEPVCGCDNITYWNDSLLGAARASVKAAGVCPGPVTCSALRACPQGTYCNYEVNQQALCAAGLEGTCWALPSSCPTSNNGRAHICGQSSRNCKGLCEAIRGQRPWFDDNACN